MTYTILEQNGTEITNIDGAAFNHFTSGNKNGILPCILSECAVYSASSSSISVSTGELLIQGFRVKLTEPYTYTFNAAVQGSVIYSIVAVLTVTSDGQPSFSITTQPKDNAVIPNDNIFSEGSGSSGLEIATFVYSAAGVSNINRTAEVLISGGFKGKAIKSISQKMVGNTNTITIQFTDDTKFEFEVKNGEKGDSGIGDAKLSNTVGESDTDGYTQKTVNSLIANPNLLINGDFKINQRGQTSYEGYVYSVDRWIGNTGVTITPLNNGIRLSRDTLGNALLQRVENWKDFVGKTLTLSAKITSNTGKVRLSIFTNQTSATEFFDGTGIIKLTRTIPQNADRLETFIGLDSNTAVEIEYMKLELGSVATSFSPRPYAEEFAMCQRYYKKIVPNANNSIAVGTIQPATTNAGFAVFNFGIPMQKTPTISYSSLSDLAIGYNDTSTGQTTITSMGFANTDRSLTTYKSYVTGTGFTPGQFTYFVVKPNGYIEFDAEIY